MKLSLFLCLLMVAMCAAGGKEWEKIKKWQQVKVLEWCYGEDAIKQVMVTWKKAYTECSGIDMPELDLPMFNSPYRLIKALMDGAEKTENSNMELILDQFQNTKPMPEPNVQLIKLLLQQQQQQQRPGKRVQNMLLRQMLRKNRNNYGSGMGDFDISSLFSSTDNFRMKRQAEEGEARFLELGERLSEKLEKQQKEWKAMAGNLTCMLKKIKYIKNDERLNLDGLLAEIEEYTYPDQWLKTKDQEIARRCYAKAEALPREVLNECIWGDNFAKIYEYLKCSKMASYKGCMQYDTKKKLEENFGSIDTLVDQTGIPQKMLLEMVQELLQAEMDFFDM